ncbi:MAG: hypothetical protein ACYSR1_08730 [Planctomycetota bacterium]|jgi:hypothetical protein
MRRINIRTHRNITGEVWFGVWSHECKIANVNLNTSCLLQSKAIVIYSAMRKKSLDTRIHRGVTGEMWFGAGQ